MRGDGFDLQQGVAAYAFQGFRLVFAMRDQAFPHLQKGLAVGVPVFQAGLVAAVLRHQLCDRSLVDGHLLGGGHTAEQHVPLFPVALDRIHAEFVTFRKVRQLGRGAGRTHGLSSLFGPACSGWPVQAGLFQTRYS